MAGKKWTGQEEATIKENYENASAEDFSLLLPDRTYKSIECMASRLGLNKPTRGWDEAELETLKEHYPYSTPQEILKLLPQRNNQTITHMANKLGIYREDYRWTEEEDDILREYYSNTTVKEIMRMLPSRTDNSIKLRARKLGLWQDESLPYRKYSYNYDFFSVPNTTNSYYAGLIASDGSVSTTTHVLRISLKENDSYILQQFINDINYTGELKFFNDTPGANSVIKDKTTETPTALLALSGAGKIITDLEHNYNIVPNKTLILQPPKSLDLVDKLAFIVGLIDGDGSISHAVTKRKRVNDYHGIGCSIAGTFALLTWVKEVFDVLCPNVGRTNAEVLKMKNTNIWIYRAGGNRAYHILKELQKVNTPTRLARKWNKIAEYEALAGLD